jgi:uncharacterized membrane protein YeaQ/YmgE (transglycosylase-associated protein family)
MGGWIFTQAGVRILAGFFGTVLESFLGAVLLLLIFSLVRRS